MRVVPIILMALSLSACSFWKEPEPIKVDKEFIIADISTAQISQEYVLPYLAGMEMAIEEINRKGGVNGIPLRLKGYNDFGNYRDAYNAAKRADIEGKALILSGTFLLQSAKGVALYAKENKIPFLATGTTTESIIFGDIASDYVFRLRSGVDINAEALAQIIAKENQIKSFAVLTYSNEEGDYISAKIKESIRAKRDDVNFAPDIKVGQFNAFGNKIAEDSYHSFSQGLIIAVNGSDIQNLVLLLEKTKATINKNVYILYAGEPEWLDSLGKYTPNNWVTTGFPWYAIGHKENIDFYKKFEYKYKIKPRFSTYLGYSAVYIIFDAIQKSQIKNNDSKSKLALAKALEQASFNSPFGMLNMRADHQSDMGVYVGKLKPFDSDTKYDGKIIRKLDVRMFDSNFVGIDNLFSPEVGVKIRKQNIKDIVVPDLPPEKN